MVNENLKGILTDFQEFIISNKLTQEKNVPFFALIYTHMTNAPKSPLDIITQKGNNH